MAEKPKFDSEKFKTVLHYIVDCCGNKSNVGKTVLFKILYFSDFDFYELYEKSITGETYVKLPHGPAPRHFNDTVKELKKEGKIIELNVPYGKNIQNKFISKAKPNLKLLSAEEIKLIDKTIQKISIMNANNASSYSHGDMPWKSAKEKENLDYEMVFYRDDVYTVSDELDDNK